ncbi:MAG: NAD-dependent epimerase/dehydratase family protein, partial [Bacteroidia bacterium]
KLIEEIFSYYNKDGLALAGRIEWVEGSLEDVFSLEEALEGVEYVYHAAAIVSFYPKDRNALLKVNIEGTSNLVNAALEKGVRKFCHISSVASLGRPVHAEKIVEEHWWKTDPSNSWYAISKYGAEREVWRASEEGLNVVILNPSFILGPGDASKSSSVVFGLAKKGMSWFTKGITGYVDARDVADAAVRLMESDVCNERFILNAANLSYHDFLDQVLTAMNQPKTSRYARPWMTALAWRFEKLRSIFGNYTPQLTKETHQAAHAVNRFGGEKIKTALPDFEYRKMEDTIREVSSYYNR